MLRRPLYTALFLALLATILPAHGRERVALRHVTLDLPGPPSKVISVDLNGDGRQDLVIIVAYTEIENVGESYIEEMVQITTVIPFLLDRREVRAYLATEEGTYEAAGSPLKMPPSVLHMEAGPPGASVVALTDEGLSVLRFDPDGSWHHIVSSRTGRSPDDVLSVTVAGPTAFASDALATAVLLMSPREGVRFIDSLPGFKCMVIDGEGHPTLSADWTG